MTSLTGGAVCCIWVGSLINYENPFEDVKVYNFVPSEVLISSDHQDEDLAFKWPAITDTVSLYLLMSLRFDTIESNSELFWLGEW